MESARDRVAIKTFDSAMPERTVYTLYALGSVVRQWLLEDIMSHSPAEEHPPSSRNLREAVIAVIRLLMAMPSDPTR